MDILGMIAIFVLGVIAYNFGCDSHSIVIKIFGIVLETIALSYIFYKIIKGV